MRAELLGPDPDAGTLGALADLLVDCVAGGASVGFLAPLDRDEAADWWRRTLVVEGPLTWVVRDDAAVLGCVRLVPATFPNGAHRAEVSKLLVMRGARGRGVATVLLAALEDEARRLGRTLLHLDTETGSPAETVYRRLGWAEFGRLDDHARRPDGQLAATTFLFKALGP